MSDLTNLANFHGAHLATCLVMTGVIWVIQLVHYPAFSSIAEEKFAEFIRFHGNRISLLVAPLMIVELITGVVLAFLNNWELLWGLNLIGIAATWASTFFLSVPCHKQLSRGKDWATIQKLVATNWPRTLIWSVRSVILSYEVF